MHHCRKLLLHEVETTCLQLLDECVHVELTENYDD